VIYFVISLLVPNSALSDITSDGKLDVEEFSIAMHIIRKLRGGMPLPSTLPSSLQPGASATGVVSPAAVTTPLSSSNGRTPTRTSSVNNLSNINSIIFSASSSSIPSVGASVSLNSGQSTIAGAVASGPLYIFRTIDDEIQRHRAIQSIQTSESFQRVCQQIDDFKARLKSILVPIKRGWHDRPICECGGCPFDTMHLHDHNISHVVDRWCLDLDTTESVHASAKCT
jgi:hypothetical protein